MAKSVKKISRSDALSGSSVSLVIWFLEIILGTRSLVIRHLLEKSVEEYLAGLLMVSLMARQSARTEKLTMLCF